MSILTSGTGRLESESLCVGAGIAARATTAAAIICPFFLTPRLLKSSHPCVVAEKPLTQERLRGT